MENKNRKWIQKSGKFDIRKVGIKFSLHTRQATCSQMRSITKLLEDNVFLSLKSCSGNVKWSYLVVDCVSLFLAKKELCLLIQGHRGNWQDWEWHSNSGHEPLYHFWATSAATILEFVLKRKYGLHSWSWVLPMLCFFSRVESSLMFVIF